MLCAIGSDGCVQDRDGDVWVPVAVIFSTAAWSSLLGFGAGSVSDLSEEQKQ